MFRGEAVPPSESDPSRADAVPDWLNVLVGRAKSGDDAALDELVREVRQAVLRYALAQRMSRDDAEDLAQEVCLAVLKVVPEWRESGRSMWGYVFAVARNKIADGVRRQVRQGPLGRPVAIDDEHGTAAMHIADDQLGPEDQALAQAGTARMDELLRQLPSTQREVLLLRAVVGLSGPETAEALKLSPGSVHVLQHRAVTKLRSLLAAQTDGAPKAASAGDSGGQR
jgi:RNA polymerase sigma-70 factor (ECF subfamily)